MRELDAAHNKLESNLKKAKGLDKLKSDADKAGKASQSTAKNLTGLSTSTTKFDHDAEKASRSVKHLTGEMAGAQRASSGLMNSLRQGVNIGGSGGMFGGGILPGLANISNIIQGIPQIGQLAGAIINPLKEGAEEGVKLNMTLEQADIAFTNVAGSAEKAHEHVMKVLAMGASSPFRFEGLLAGVRLMNTFGFELDEQLPKLTIWGNAIAAGGEITSESVRSVVTAFGQMRMAGRVNAQDMMQLTNANIPGWQLLAKAIGKTVAETRKLSEAGKLNGKVAVEAITAMMAIDPRFQGMMDKLQKSTAGRVSAFQDMIQIAQGTATQGLTTNLSKTIQDILDRPDIVPTAASAINAALTPISALIETGVKTVLTPGITTGIVEGIQTGKDMVKKALVDFAEDTIIGSIKGALGINSPSKEFMEIGYGSAEGYRDGLLAGLRSMAGEMTAGFDDLLDELEGHLQTRQKRFVSVQQKSKANLDKLIAKEPDFMPKLIAGAKARGMNPDHILNVMAVETAGSFNPYIRNPNSSASGMIQFMKATAPTLGTTIEAIRKMNATQQLDYVFKYFDQYIRKFGPLDTQGKVYAAVGTGRVARNDEDVVMRRGQLGYAGNAPTWDRNMDGLIKQSEMAQAAIAKLGAGITFTVNGQPIAQTNPVPVYIATGVSDKRIGGWLSAPKRDAHPRAVDPQFVNAMPPIDTSGTVLIEPDLLNSMIGFDPSKLALALRPLKPMLVESAGAAKTVADEIERAAKAAENPALGPGQWYKATTAMGSMTQRLSEFFDTLPENKRFIEDIFIDLPSRFGDVMGSAVAQADGTLKGFWKEVESGAVQMIRQIAAEITRQLTTRLMTQFFIGALGRPEMDPNTGEPTGRNVGGWLPGLIGNIPLLGKLFNKPSGSTGGTGSLLAGALGSSLPKRAFGGPVLGGISYVVGDHPSGRPNPEIFTPSRDGYITPVSEAVRSALGGMDFSGRSRESDTFILALGEKQFREAMEEYGSTAQGKRARVMKFQRDKKTIYRR